jgi:hypothetical protein
MLLGPKKQIFLEKTWIGTNIHALIEVAPPMLTHNGIIDGTLPIFIKDCLRKFNNLAFDLDLIW